MVSKVSIAGLSLEDKKQYLGPLMARLCECDDFVQVNSTNRDGGVTILSSPTEKREGFKDAIKGFFEEQDISQMPTLGFID